MTIFRELGMQTAPAVVVDVDDAKARVLAQTLNRTRGQDDPEAYARLLDDVLKDMSIAEVVAFLPETAESIGRMLNGLDLELGMPEEDDDVFEVPDDPESVLGEVYELGPHRLICGDSTDASVIDLATNGEFADCVWTDPPYGVDYVGKTSDALTIQNDGAANLRDLLIGAFRAIDFRLADGSPIYIAHPPGREAQDFYFAATEMDWRIHQVIVWVKNTMVLGHRDYHSKHEPIMLAYKTGEGRSGRGGRRWYGDHSQTSVLEFPKPSANREHPTMKPIDLISQMLRNSTKRDDLVLDPFGGSGSTLMAADALGRRAALVEIDPRYCDVIRRRYEKASGNA
jgi:site-specific DNA-methyltransferase (adenine-specific)